MFEEASKNYRFRPKVTRLVKRAVTPRKQNADETIQLTSTRCKNGKPTSFLKKKLRRKTKAELQKNESLIQRNKSEELLKENQRWLNFLFVSGVFLFSLLIILGPVIKHTMPEHALRPKVMGVPSNTTLDPPSLTSCTPSQSPSDLSPLNHLAKWKRDYVHFHEKVTNHFQTHQKPPPGAKMMVYLASPSKRRASDVSEHQKAIVSLFALCVAHGIAFYVDWPLAQDIYDFPHISLHINATELSQRLPVWEPPEDESESFSFQNITLVQTKQLRLYDFLGDQFPKTRGMLNSKGITIDSSFHDLSSFLFAPIEPIYSSIQPLVTTLLKSTSVFIENTLPETGEATVLTKDTLPFFTCARRIYKRIQAEGTESVVWFLENENPELEKAAKTEFGANIELVSLDKHFNSSQDELDQLRWMVARKHLGSVCDYFLVSDTEGIDVVMQSGKNKDRAFFLNIKGDLSTEGRAEDFSTSCEPLVFANILSKSS